MIQQSGDFYALSCDVCGETYMTFGETFDEAVRWGKQNGANYRNTEDDVFHSDTFKWRPSIHMPKEAARLFLLVENARIERVQEILISDMLAEGCVPEGVKGGQWQQWQRDYFIPFWDSLYAKRGFPFSSNPWVWVTGFRKISKEEAYAGGQ